MLTEDAFVTFPIDLHNQVAPSKCCRERANKQANAGEREQAYKQMLERASNQANAGEREEIQMDLFEILSSILYWQIAHSNLPTKEEDNKTADFLMICILLCLSANPCIDVDAAF